MEPGASMPHSQGLSNNPYSEQNQPNSSRSILILSSHLRLGLPKYLFPVGLPVNILKALLPSSILATCPPHIVRMIKSSRVRWGGHVARLEKGRSAFIILTGKPTGKGPLGRLRRR